MAPKLFRRFAIGIASFAGGIESLLAKKALSAGDREWHHDPIAALEILNTGSDFNNLPHRFVTEHVAALHLGDHAVKDMEIGAANRAGRDLDDRVSAILDFWIRHGFASDVVLAVPGQSFHGGSLSARRTRLFGPNPTGARLFLGQLEIGVRELVASFTLKGAHGATISINEEINVELSRQPSTQASEVRC